MIAWHYTTGLHLPLIRESGVLRPSGVFIGPDERPVLWFSTASYWEPTAAKMTPWTSIEERLKSAGWRFPVPPALDAGNLRDG